MRRRGHWRCDLCKKERARDGFLLCQACFEMMTRIRDAVAPVYQCMAQLLAAKTDGLLNRGDDRRDETKVKAAAASVTETPVKFIEIE